MEKITLKQFVSADKKMAINCRTKLQAIILMRALNKAGKRWENGEKYKMTKTNWDWEEEQTCYTNDGRFDTIFYYKYYEKDMEIYDFNDIVWEKKSQHDESMLTA